MQKIVEADPDSPYRCQGRGQGAEGQCRFLSMEGLVSVGENPYEHEPQQVEGVNVCPKCGGVGKVRKAVKDQVRKYQIASLKNEITRQLSNGDMVDLSEELALSRVLLERLLNGLGNILNGPELFAYAPQIERTIARIESLAGTYQKLQEKAGSMLSPEQAIKYAQQLTEVVLEFVPEKLHEEAAAALQERLI